MGQNGLEIERTTVGRRLKSGWYQERVVDVVMTVIDLDMPVFHLTAGISWRTDPTCRPFPDLDPV